MGRTSHILTIGKLIKTKHKSSKLKWLLKANKASTSPIDLVQVTSENL